MEKSFEMPFLDHLEELRTRLMWALGALIIGVMIGFAVVMRFNVIKLLERPVLPYLQGNLIVTHPTDAFKIVMMVSFGLGLVLALPVILYQLWSFLSPALYKHEKRVIVPVLIAAAALFLGGILIAWFFVLPYTLKFLLTFQASAFDSFIRAEEYFSFATTVSIAFGAVFELPIAILLLTALGFITPKFLHTYRKHAIVLCVVVAAFITPGGDPMSLLAFSLPLYFLFEISVLLSEVVYRRRVKRVAKREREDALEQEQERELERAGETDA